MSEIPNIPTNQTNIQAQAKVLIQSFALAAIKTSIFTGTIPKGPAKTGEIGRDKELYLSGFGTPVMSNFNVQSGTYTKNGQNFSFDEIKIDLALFEVQLAKNIIKTPIQGRNGTVKEYISDDDYSVNIRGILVAPNNQFPLDEFVALLKVVKAPVAIKVNSWYLEKVGIYNLVITSADFSQQAGQFSRQMFNIHAISDTPIELNIAK
jgi:hypothetical protein